MKKVNSMKKSFVLILLIGIVVSLSLIGLKQQQVKSETGLITLRIKSIGNTTVEYYNGSGSSPLKLLEIRHNVKTGLNKQFVKCIDGVCAENEYGWSLFVNDKYINYAVNTYKIKRGDKIMFEFSKGDKT